MPAEFPQDDVALTISRCVEALSDLGVLRAELTVLRLIPEPRARFATALFDMERARQGDPDAQEQLARITQQLMEHQERGTGATLSRAHPALSQLWATAQANLKNFGSSRLATLLANCYLSRHSAVELSRAVAALEPDDDRRVEFARCLYHLQLARLGIDTSRAEFARRVELVTEAFKSTDAAHEFIGLDEGLRHLWNDLKPYLSEFFEVQEEVQRKLKRGEVTTDPSTEVAVPATAMAPPPEAPYFVSSPTEPGRMFGEVMGAPPVAAEPDPQKTITTRTHASAAASASVPTAPELSALKPRGPAAPDGSDEEPLENSAKTVRVPIPVAPTSNPALNPALLPQAQPPSHAPALQTVELPVLPSAPAPAPHNPPPPAAGPPPLPPRTAPLQAPPLPQTTPTPMRRVPGFSTLMGSQGQLGGAPRTPMPVAQYVAASEQAHTPREPTPALPVSRERSQVSTQVSEVPADSSKTAELPFDPTHSERLTLAAAEVEQPIDEFTDAVIEAAEVVEDSLHLPPEAEEVSSVEVADMGESADMVEPTEALDSGPPPPPATTAPHGRPALDVDIDEPPPDEATAAFWSESIRALQLLPNPEEVRVAGRVLSVDTKEDRRRLQEYLDSLEPWFIVPDAMAFGCLLRLALAGQLKEKSLFGAANPRRAEAFQSAFALLLPDARAAAHGASWFQFDGAESEEGLSKGLEVLADFLGYCSRKGKDPLDAKAQAAFLSGGK